MKIFKRICIKDYTLEATNGDKLELFQGKEYTTSQEHDGMVTVLTNYWVPVSADLFAEVETLITVEDVVERVKSIKREGGIPRVHGNGFIQLNTRDDQHLHIWGPQIPFKQTVYSGIHNHVFDFQSVCLVGELIHNSIDLEMDVDDFTHYTYQAVCHDGTDNTVLEKVGQARLVTSETVRYTPGDTYTFKAGDFHESNANIPTATLMTKTGNHRDTMGEPIVLCDKAFLPSNDFTRYQDPDVLWRIIFKTLT